MQAVMVITFSYSTVQHLVKEMASQFNAKKDSLRVGFESSIRSIGDQMLAKNLICIGVYEKQSFDVTVDEFFKGLKLCSTITMLRERIEDFLEILRDAGGSLMVAAIEFSEKWTNMLNRY